MDPFSLLLQASASSAPEVVSLPSVTFQPIFIWIINFFLDAGSADYEQKLSTLLFLIRYGSIFLSLLFIVGVVYAKMQLAQLEHRRHDRFAPKGSAHGHQAAPTATEIAVQKHDSRWVRIEERVGSANEADWRLAVLEADVMLDDMLKAMGAFGDTLGERLKSTNTDMLPSLQKAWEGHLVRNQIAHEGADFKLSQHEARRVVGLFEAVLREGRYI